MRANLPKEPAYRNVGLAALIQAASHCAASPGHTAQPFKPNDTAGGFLIASWQRNLPSIVADRAQKLSMRCAKIRGKAYCCSALEIADQAMPGDLAFVDPPYSGVHYSRFYHVLETIARGQVGAVFGAGRYPPIEERPSSEFSMKSQSQQALNNLLSLLSDRGANVIITFPAGNASNGLSGEKVRRIASQYFYIDEEKVSSRFSTMGGNAKHRASRKEADELILNLSVSRNRIFTKI